MTFEATFDKRPVHSSTNTPCSASLSPRSQPSQFLMMHYVAAFVSILLLDLPRHFFLPHITTTHNIFPHPHHKRLLDSYISIRASGGWTTLLRCFINISIASLPRLQRASTSLDQNVGSSTQLCDVQPGSQLPGCGNFQRLSHLPHRPVLEDF